MCPPHLSSAGYLTVICCFLQPCAEHDGAWGLVNNAWLNWPSCRCRCCCSSVLGSDALWATVSTQWLKRLCYRCFHQSAGCFMATKGCHDRTVSMNQSSEDGLTHFDTDPVFYLFYQQTEENLSSNVQGFGVCPAEGLCLPICSVFLPWRGTESTGVWGMLSWSVLTPLQHLHLILLWAAEHWGLCSHSEKDVFVLSVGAQRCPETIPDHQSAHGTSSSLALCALDDLCFGCTLEEKSWCSGPQLRVMLFLLRRETDGWNESGFLSHRMDVIMFAVIVRTTVLENYSSLSDPVETSLASRL